MSEWWQKFFRGPWLEFQRSYGLGAKSELTAKALASLLQLPSGSKVLDAPCGTGRIAIELAALGHEVTGLDISGDLLSDARQKARIRGLTVQWVPGDMRQAAAESEFEAAICYWGSFGYFDDEGNLDQARATHRALAPGGRYLIDTASLETLVPRFQPRGWGRAGDITALEHRVYNPLTGRLRATWTFYDQDRKLGEHESDIRIYSAPELVGLLRRAGFEKFAAYGDIEGTPYSLSSQRLILVATR